MESLRSLYTLRRFLRKPVRECCELCNAALGEEHAHLLKLSSRHITCACDMCALLFDRPGSGQYRRISRRIVKISGFRLADELWESLDIPISLAFFHFSSLSDKIVVTYPSPAGPIESSLDIPSWDDLARENPILKTLEPDVEALLVNRVESENSYFLSPIDECFRLVGLIRTSWRGLSGGSEAWSLIRRFFDELAQRSVEGSACA